MSITRSLEINSRSSALALERPRETMPCAHIHMQTHVVTPDDRANVIPPDHHPHPPRSSTARLRIRVLGRETALERSLTR